MHKILWEDQSWAEWQLIKPSVLIGQKGGCDRGGGPSDKKKYMDSSYMTEPSKNGHTHTTEHMDACAYPVAATGNCCLFY